MLLEDPLQELTKLCMRRYRRNQSTCRVHVTILEAFILNSVSPTLRCTRKRMALAIRHIV